MKFDIRNRWSGEVQFTADIDCDEGAEIGIKIGLAVKWAVKTGASLDGANLTGANLTGANLTVANLNGANLYGANLYGANLTWASLDGANLTGASLDGASLDGASLDGVNGINDWIKNIQIEQYPISYTSDVIQIGCQRHTHAEWREFDDAAILNMDGRVALKWWRKYKDWLFQTIELCPAKPTKSDEAAQ